MSGCLRHIATRVIAAAILLSVASGVLVPPAAMAAADRSAAMTGWQDPAATIDAGCTGKNEDHPFTVSARPDADCELSARRCRTQGCSGDYLFSAQSDNRPVMTRIVGGSLPASHWIDVSLRQIPPPPRPGLS